MYSAMTGLLSLALSIFLLLIARTDAESSCRIPIYIPIHNVTLPNQQIRRGAAISVGTPPQDLAFTVSRDTNNSIVFDTTAGKECGSSYSATQCYVQRGGFFNSSASSSWKQLSMGFSDPSVAPESTDHNSSVYSDYGEDVWGNDTFSSPDGSFSLPSFPFGIYKTDQSSSIISLNSLGLGKESLLLTNLVKSQLTVSRVWSLWWGWVGSDASTQRDGSLVLGGYDAEFTKGSNHTSPFSIDKRCTSGMIVTLSDLSVTFPNGSSASIYSGANTQEIVQGCINPVDPLVTLPGTLLDAFTIAIYNQDQPPPSLPPASRGMNPLGQLYDVNTMWAGDLRYTLDSGLVVTIPNHQLAVEDLYVSSSGAIVAPNSTNREVLVYDVEDPDGNVGAKFLALMGLPFLQSSYLMVDTDANSFTLWANDAPSTTQDLRFPGGSGCPPSPSGLGPMFGAKKPSNTLSTGAVVGAVLAGVFGLGGILGLSFFLYRRHQKLHKPFRVHGTKASDKEHHEQASVQELGPGSRPEQYFGRHEMPATTRLEPASGSQGQQQNNHELHGSGPGSLLSPARPQELASSDSNIERPVFEMPAEVSKMI